VGVLFQLLVIIRLPLPAPFGICSLADSLTETLPEWETSVSPLQLFALAVVLLRLNWPEALLPVKLNSRLHGPLLSVIWPARMENGLLALRELMRVLPVNVIFPVSFIPAAPNRMAPKNQPGVVSATP